MSSIRREMVIEARPHDVWAAVRDVGAPHKHLAPGFLVDTRLDDGVRVVTFANGLVRANSSSMSTTERAGSRGP